MTGPGMTHSTILYGLASVGCPLRPFCLGLENRWFRQRGGEVACGSAWWRRAADGRCSRAVRVVVERPFPANPAGTVRTAGRPPGRSRQCP